MQPISLVKRIGLSSIVAILVLFFAAGANAQLGTSSVPGGDPDPGTVGASYTYYPAAHVANGGSLRNVGKTTIRLEGMPSDAIVTHAWLYWDFVGLTAPTKLQSNVCFDGDGGWDGTVDKDCNHKKKIPGTLIGSGGNPCWGGANTNFAFRADVTWLVHGNGIYTVELLPGAAATTNGSNPWGPTGGGPPYAEGASIVAIYTSKIEPMGTVLLYDSGLAGTEWLGTLSYSLGGVPTIPGVSSSIFTELGADGQIGGGVTAASAVSDEVTTLNTTFPIAGPGSNATDSDWNGDDGIPLNQLWDTHSHDVTGDLVSGVNGVSITSAVWPADVSYDCLVAIANVLTVR